MSMIGCCRRDRCFLTHCWTTAHTHTLCVTETASGHVTVGDCSTNNWQIEHKSTEDDCVSACVCVRSSVVGGASLRVVSRLDVLRSCPKQETGSFSSQRRLRGSAESLNVYINLCHCISRAEERSHGGEVRGGK